MAVCEKCWGDAYVRSLSTPGKDQAEHYRDLLEERKGTPCAMVDVDSVIPNPEAPVKSEGEKLTAGFMEEGESQHCSVCGSYKVLIRGKFPKDEKRRICPTCTYERLEQINEISSENYGKAYSEPKLKG